MSLLFAYFIVLFALSATIAQGIIMRKEDFRRPSSAVSLHSKVKRQGDDIDPSCFNTAALNCSLQLDAIGDPYEYEDNIPEFTKRTNDYTNLLCTDPCYSTFQEFYMCAGGELFEQLAELQKNILCLKGDDNEFCYPKTQIYLVSIEEDPNDPCGNFTSSTCSSECRADVLEVFNQIGCCGFNILQGVSNFGENEGDNPMESDREEDMFSNIISCLGDEYDCNSALGMSGMGPVGMLAMVAVTIMTAMFSL